jgi:hypothetical protein
MHHLIFEPFLDDIRSYYKGHQVRDAKTSRCRIRFIVNGNKDDKAYITVHNVFATLMILAQEANAYFLTIHASYDTDDRMPTSPDWYDATFEDENMLQPFLDVWTKTQFDWTQLDIVKTHQHDESLPCLDVKGEPVTTRLSMYNTVQINNYLFNTQGPAGGGSRPQGGANSRPRHEDRSASSSSSAKSANYGYTPIPYHHSTMFTALSTTNPHLPQAPLQPTPLDLPSLDFPTNDENEYVPSPASLSLPTSHSSVSTPHAPAPLQCMTNHSSHHQSLVSTALAPPVLPPLYELPTSTQRSRVTTLSSRILLHVSPTPHCRLDSADIGLLPLQLTKQGLRTDHLSSVLIQILKLVSSYTRFFLLHCGALLVATLVALSTTSPRRHQLCYYPLIFGTIPTTLALPRPLKRGHYRANAAWKTPPQSPQPNVTHPPPPTVPRHTRTIPTPATLSTLLFNINGLTLAKWLTLTESSCPGPTRRHYHLDRNTSRCHHPSLHRRSPLLTPIP